jgi:hypothetical protein
MSHSRNGTMRRHALRLGQHLLLLLGLSMLIPVYSSISNVIALRNRQIALSVSMVLASRVLALWRGDRETVLDAILTVAAFALFAVGLKLRLGG